MKTTFSITKRPYFKGVMVLMFVLVCANFLSTAVAILQSDAPPSGIHTAFHMHLAPLTALFRAGFPILTVLAGGFFYYDEREDGTTAYKLVRQTRQQYFITIARDSFVITLITTFLPLLFSSLLHVLAFPTTVSFHSDTIWTTEFMLMSGPKGFLAPSYIINTPALVPFLSALGISLFAALLALLTTTLTFFFNVSKVLLILPTFLYLYLIDTVINYVNVKEFNPLELFVPIFTSMEKSAPYLIGTLLTILVISMVLLHVKVKIHED